MRGFDIRGVGPRVIRTPYVPVAEGTPGAIAVENLLVGNAITPNGFIALSDDPRFEQDDSLGGQAYYLARAEMNLPLGEGIEELGIRPSVFVDVGALWDVNFNEETDLFNLPTREFQTTDADGNPITARTPGFREEFFGDSPSPRLSVGIGASWNSPFGPFRFDVSKALLKEPGDDTQIFQFNVGTSF